MKTTIKYLSSRQKLALFRRETKCKVLRIYCKRQRIKKLERKKDAPQS
jgi:hypothetical protein